MKPSTRRVYTQHQQHAFEVLIVAENIALELQLEDYRKKNAQLQIELDEVLQVNFLLIERLG